MEQRDPKTLKQFSLNPKFDDELLKVYKREMKELKCREVVLIAEDGTVLAEMQAVLSSVEEDLPLIEVMVIYGIKEEDYIRYFAARNIWKKMFHCEKFDLIKAIEKYWEIESGKKWKANMGKGKDNAKLGEIVGCSESTIKNYKRLGVIGLEVKRNEYAYFELEPEQDEDNQDSGFQKEVGIVTMLRIAERDRNSRQINLLNQIKAKAAASKAVAAPKAAPVLTSQPTIPTPDKNTPEGKWDNIDPLESSPDRQPAVIIPVIPTKRDNHKVHHLNIDFVTGYMCINSRLAKFQLNGYYSELQEIVEEFINTHTFNYDQDESTKRQANEGSNNSTSEATKGIRKVLSSDQYKGMVSSVR